MAKSSNTRHQQVAEDILTKAATLFDELGYGNTSLQEIADAVGIARPSLYHYFKSKEEILSTLVERTTGTREAIATEVRRMDGTALTKLRVLVRNLARSTSANPVGLRLTLNNSGSLPPEIRQRSTRARRVVFEMFVDILSDGMDTGVFRPTDVRETAATIIAALTGVQYREIGGVHLDPDKAAELLEEMLVFGLSQPTERQASSVQHALRLLHHDIEVLEHHVRREHPAGETPS